MNQDTRTRTARVLATAATVMAATSVMMAVSLFTACGYKGSLVLPEQDTRSPAKAQSTQPATQKLNQQTTQQPTPVK